MTIATAVAKPLRMLSAYLITAATIRPPTAYNRKILNILDKTTTLPVKLSQSKLYNCILERNHPSLLYCSLLQRQPLIQTLAPRYLENERNCKISEI